MPLGFQFINALKIDISDITDQSSTLKTILEVNALIKAEKRKSKCATAARCSTNGKDLLKDGSFVMFRF